MITTNQIRRIYGILGRLGIRNMKEQMVMEASQGRTASIKELSHLEAVELIRHLSNLEAEQNQAEGNADKANKQRRRILSICYQMPPEKGFVKYDASAGKHTVDLERLDKFLCSPRSIYKKPLQKHSTKELSRVIVQMEGMLKGYLNSK